MTSIKRPADRLRTGENKPIRTGRAARVRVGNHQQRAVIAYRNAGHVIARDYLASLGLDGEFVTTYESAFGRATAKVFRDTHQAEPDNGGAVLLRGRICRTNRYADAADLEAGARAYKRMAALLAERTDAAAETEQQPAEVTPVVLVAELAERYPVPAEHLAGRVEAIVSGMQANPKLYDPQRDTLTPGGVAVVRSVIYAEHVDGMLYREAEARATEQPATRTSTPAVGDTVTVHFADPGGLLEQMTDGSTGRVAFVALPLSDYSHPIHVELPGYGPVRCRVDEVEVFHQATRFLTAA